MLTGRSWKGSTSRCIWRPNRRRLLDLEGHDHRGECTDVAYAWALFPKSTENEVPKFKIYITHKLYARCLRIPVYRELIVQAVEEFVQKDPYFTSGLVDSYTIKPFNVVIKASQQ